MLSLSGIGRRAISPIPARPVMPVSPGRQGCHQGQRSRADRAIRHPPAGRPPGPAAGSHGEWQRCLHGDASPGPAEATNALISFRTTASCPRNMWPPRSIVTSRAPPMLGAAPAANRYGASGSSRALMTSVGTPSCSNGNRSAARLETKPSKTAPRAGA